MPDQSQVGAAALPPPLLQDDSRHSCPVLGEGDGTGWEALEELCLNSCLWIYSSSVIKKQIIGRFFFPFFT